jgi:hypothetical protein
MARQAIALGTWEANGATFVDETTSHDAIAPVGEFVVETQGVAPSVFILMAQIVTILLLCLLL